MWEHWFPESTLHFVNRLCKRVPLPYSQDPCMCKAQGEAKEGHFSTTTITDITTPSDMFNRTARQTKSHLLNINEWSSQSRQNRWPSLGTTKSVHIL